MGDSITIQRRVQWMDTDAAGIWHHSVVIRWAEEAEAELHRRLGIIDSTFGATPRVRTAFEFPGSVRFDDVVDVTLTISNLGTTSMTYDIEVRHGAMAVASGQMVAVFIDRETGMKKPWPEAVRTALTPAS
jgi:acyl-CoA thioester hydrolase